MVGSTLTGEPIDREPRAGAKYRRQGDRHKHKQAQEKTIRRRKDVSKTIKMTPKMIGIIEPKLRLESSPEQVSGWLLDEKCELISHESIYLHIWSDRRSGGDLYTHLLRQG